MNNQQLNQLVNQAKKQNQQEQLKQKQVLLSKLRLNWFEQLKSKYGSISNASQELGIERSSLYKWNSCKAPIPLHHIETLINAVSKWPSYHLEIN